MAEFSYKLIRSNRKTLSIQINSAGELIARCPQKMPVAEVEAFLRKKADWIRFHMKKRTSTEPPVPFTDAQRKEMANTTKARLAQRLPQLAAKVGVSYHRVTVRAQRTVWGSCSSAGNLNFNCLLALVPAEVFDYVMIHELCHRKEMNHSEKFWAEVARIMPDYPRARQWLKENGSALIRRL